MPLKILAVSAICFLVNVPMGLMRERVKKFSLAWIFWIHASIPLIIFLRVWLKLHPLAIPINIAAAVAGQLIGSLPEKRRRKAASSAS
jgi:hypothetical protein